MRLPKARFPVSKCGLSNYVMPCEGLVPFSKLFFCVVISKEPTMPLAETMCPTTDGSVSLSFRPLGLRIRSI